MRGCSRSTRSPAKVSPTISMTRQVRQKLARPRRWICVARSLLSLVFCTRARGAAGSSAGHRLLPTPLPQAPAPGSAAAAWQQLIPALLGRERGHEQGAGRRRGRCGAAPAGWYPAPPLFCPAAVPAPAAAPRWPACCSSAAPPTPPARPSGPPARQGVGGRGSALIAVHTVCRMGAAWRLAAEAGLHPQGVEGVRRGKCGRTVRARGLNDRWA